MRFVVSISGPSAFGCGPTAVFPDIKAVLPSMPEAGEDGDFNRAGEYPRDMDLS